MINIKLKKTKVYGWSRSDFTISQYYKTSSIDEVNSIFELAKKNNKKISLRSGGRSYGDNTLNEDNIILNYFSKNKIIHFDEENGVIEVCGSTSLIDILKYSIPKGWILYVCPASQFITVSGAISNNVHGKNCFSKGYFGDYVDEFQLFSYEKGILICSKHNNANLFYSVISGLGVLGIILKVKIRMKKIDTTILNTSVCHVSNLDNVIKKIENLKYSHEYNIGTLNFTRYNKNNISGKIYSSNFSNKKLLDSTINNASIFIYFINICLLINNLPLTNRVVEYFLSIITSNKILFNKNFHQNFFKMNFLGDLNLPLYNYFFKNGFIEYQVIFDKEKYFDAIIELQNLIRKNNYESYMSSIKAYKPSNNLYMFGLSKDGYCITLDIPFRKGNNFQTFIRKLNEITIKFNGQVYMGKTPCVNSNEFKQMYKEYENFKKIKISLDPNLLLSSNMFSRIFNDI